MIFLLIFGNLYVLYIKIILKLIFFNVFDFLKKKNGFKYVLMYS